MPKVDAVKIKLVRRVPRRLILLVVLFILIMGIIGLAKSRNRDCRLRLGGDCFSVEQVDTDIARENGLSGREKLTNNQAMLFVFDVSDKHCFWMKDMKFSIDMIWLDADKKIVDIKTGVSPDTFPETFCPNVSARYVIEVNAGISSQLGLKQGQTVSF